MIALGDIIRWPFGGGTDDLGLIVNVDRVNGWPILTVAPGARDLRQSRRPGMLRLTRSHELRSAGLAEPVQFDLEQSISISTGHSTLRTDPPPVVGRLCGSALERLHDARARIDALRHIAAQRRGRAREGGRPAERRTGWRRASVSATAAKGGRA